MNVHPKLRTRENVRLEAYDIAAIRRAIPCWDRLPRGVRRRYLKWAVEPVHVGEVSNVTCVGFHEYLALAATLDEGDSAQLDPPAEIGFGDDDSAFAVSDTALNNEVGDRTPITDPSSDGTSFHVDEFLSSNEQNGNTLRELGIFSEAGVLWQHSATDQVYNKDNTLAIVINIEIPISDGSP